MQDIQFDWQPGYQINHKDQHREEGMDDKSGNHLNVRQDGNIETDVFDQIGIFRERGDAGGHAVRKNEPDDQSRQHPQGIGINAADRCGSDNDGENKDIDAGHDNRPEKRPEDSQLGAGVLALIIGLGSQSLVADILAGIFIVFEGEFQVGDIVIIDGWRGEVKEIGIRTTKLVDVGGNIKIVNNSEIKTIINQTQELSLAKA